MFIFQIRRFGRDKDIFMILPNSKAGKALKLANTEATRAVKASYITRESTQVNPVAVEGKSRAKVGRNTQTNITSDHQGETSVLRLENTPSAAQWHVLNVNLRALGAYIYFKSTEATALSSKSLWLHLGHLNAVDYY
jgi:hypothetical protein